MPTENILKSQHSKSTVRWWFWMDKTWRPNLATYSWNENSLFSASSKMNSLFDLTKSYPLNANVLTNTSTKKSPRPVKIKKKKNQLIVSLWAIMIKIINIHHHSMGIIYTCTKREYILKMIFIYVYLCHIVFHNVLDIVQLLRNYNYIVKLYIIILYFWSHNMLYIS